MPKYPNILFILADDQGAWSMGCAGNPDVKTPALDALARQGTRFESFFCTSPVCSPARASILTGKMPSQHGVHDWLARGYLDEEKLSPALRRALAAGDPDPKYSWPRSQLLGDRAIRYMDGQTLYTQLLSEAGYDCALSGKWHLGGSDLPQGGFRWWRSIAMGGDNYFTPTVRMEDGTFDMLENVYITDYITDNALDYLKNRPADRPFYLSVHYTAPHSPFDRKNHPAENFAPFDDCAFASVPLEAPHPWSGADPEKWEDARIEALRGYSAALYGMDKGVGRLLSYLDEAGLSGNTVVAFVGDNGMNVGQHGIIGKGNATFPMNMYEESVKVPCIVRYPGRIAEGRVESRPCGHADIFPTIADFLGVPAPEELCGRSLLPLLRGEALPDDDVVIFDEYGPTRMVRTRAYKLVHRCAYGPDELYCLADDPGERNNLVDDPAHTDIKRELMARLQAFFLKYADPRVDGSREAVYGKGQIRRVGAYSEGYPSFLGGPPRPVGKL